MAGFGTGQIINAAGQTAIAGVDAYEAYRLNQKLKGINDQYNIPSEIGQNLSDANQRVLQGLPAAFQNQYKQELANNAAYSTSNLGSLNAGLRGVAGANQQMNEGDQKLLAMNAQAQNANQKDLYDQRANMADYKDMQWKHNVDNPYQLMQQQRNAYGTAALKQAGNVFSSFAGTTTPPSAPQDKTDWSNIKIDPASYGLEQPVQASSPQANGDYNGGYSGNPYDQTNIGGVNGFNRNPYGYRLRGIAPNF